LGVKFSEMLRNAQQGNDSMLCVGLDPEPARFPGAWRGDASRTLDFCRRTSMALDGAIASNTLA